jgi:hypothetical protein
MKNMGDNAYYHSKLGVRFYDFFSGDAGRNGPVKGDVDFFIDCARQFRRTCPRVSNRHGTSTLANRGGRFRYRRPRHF